MGFLNSLMPKIFLVKKPCGKCSYTVFLESSKLIVNWGLKLKNFLEKKFFQNQFASPNCSPRGIRAELAGVAQGGRWFGFRKQTACCADPSGLPL